MVSQGRLRGAIGIKPTIRTSEGGAEDVDDCTAAARDQVGNCGLTAVERSAEMHVHLGRHVLLPVRFKKRFLGVNVARVVDENVQSAKCGDRPCDHGADVVAVSDVGPFCDSSSARLLDFGDDAFGTLPTGKEIDRDRGTPLAELARDRGADLAAGAGYERDLSFEISHRALPNDCHVLLRAPLPPCGEIR
jgi:hypothetical protein